MICTLIKEWEIGPKYRVSNPHQRQGNKKYVWKTPPTLLHSKSRGKKPDIHTH